jgi:hypothetical protein
MVHLRTARQMRQAKGGTPHQPDSAVTAAHCVEITLLTEIVDNFHQVRLGDTGPRLWGKHRDNKPADQQ